MGGFIVHGHILGYMKKKSVIACITVHCNMSTEYTKLYNDIVHVHVCFY